MTTLKTINDYKNRQVLFINNISFEDFRYMKIHIFALRWRDEIKRSSQLRTLLKRVVVNRTWKRFRPVRDLNPWPLRYRFISHINFKHERDDSEFSIITYAMALTWLSNLFVEYLSMVSFLIENCQKLFL